MAALSTSSSPLRAPAIAALWPGLAVTLGLAALASVLHRLPAISVLSPLILATALGIAVRALAGPRPGLLAGQQFVLRRLLRIAIVLLGFQISFAQVAAIGVGGVAIVLFAVPATFLFVRLAGRALGLDPGLTDLIASGTSVCGASAIAAVNTVVGAPEEDVAYAVACITLFGTASMFLYPVLAPALHLTGLAYGLWSGGSIHEVAQAVGAADQGGAAAGQAGVVAKLLRVALLGPLVMALALRARRTGGEAPAPWFLAGFLVVIALNSVVPPPAAVAHGLAVATTFLMTMALAAMGLATDLRALRRRGLRPLALGGLGTAFIALLVLTLVVASG
jgi:uncharacterized integral membrane protein (TIGR00698 family)